MQSENSSAQKIETLIRARYPLIYVVSFEEGRVSRNLKLMTDARKKELAAWTITAGLETPDGSFITELKDPIKVLDYILQSGANGLFVLRDYHHYLNDPVVVRKLRDAARELKMTRKNIIFLSPVLKVPTELEKEIAVIDYELPDKEELALIIGKISGSLDGRGQPAAAECGRQEKIVEAALGLTAEEAENVFAKSLVQKGMFDVSIVLSEKEQIIRKSGVLEYYHTNENMKEVGGLDELKKWLVKRGKAFTPKAREFGLPEPRGILLLGIPGCGKSLTAKAIAGLWQLPLLKLDVGKVFSSYVGSSEENVRRAIQTAESIAPSILWLDEMEKGFSGLSSSGMSDGGTTARVFGTFLTWLQEKTTPVFVVATSNNVSQLPPELLRKGRFDEIFYVDLPAKDEREEIFRIHLQKRGRGAEGFDLAAAAAKTGGFSGSEIEEVIVSALYDAFDQDSELLPRHIEAGIQAIIPLSQTMEEQIRGIREWAKLRARRASSIRWEEESGAVRQLEM
ncbi:MAG: AAA family ATPase [Spirochaetales bacterium]|jgi:SpoVK/Ycf46/Vps4 family AAA+-type ATPase|nr:AAA family ATPase [Spirochaetales bacterium]